jgi:hypothetical protein
MTEQQMSALRNGEEAYPTRAPDPRRGRRARRRCLREGVDAPDMATVKDFLRFHIAASRGNIGDEERLTTDSLNAFAEWFFAGFARLTTYTRRSRVLETLSTRSTSRG